MDIATIVGLVLGSILVVSAIVLGGSAGMFINIPSLLIVFGGTIAATMMKFTMADMTNTFTLIAKSFTASPPDPIALIEKVKELSEVTRKEGLLSLEGKEFGDPFLAKGVGMLIDGTDLPVVTALLGRELQYIKDRHKKGQGMLKGMSDTAPAFGMIGTLIGLVQMLAAMDDPSKIGPAMAVALLTTLYGAVFANLIFLPLAEKLDFRSKEEVLARDLVIAGVESIARGDHPRLIEEQLKVFLAPKLRPIEQG